MGLFPIHLRVVAQVLLAEVGRTGTKSRRGTSFHSRDLGRTFEGKSSSNDSLADKICFFSLRTRVVAWPSPVVGVRRVAHADPRPLKRNRGGNTILYFFKGEACMDNESRIVFFYSPAHCIRTRIDQRCSCPPKNYYFSWNLPTLVLL